MFNNLDFNPAEAYRKLMDFSKELNELCGKVVVKRSEVVMAEACLMDKKAESFVSKRAQFGITEAKEWVKFDTLAEEKEFITKKAELQNLIDLKNTLESVCNNYKLAIKMAEVEIKNLNLQS